MHHRALTLTLSGLSVIAAAGVASAQNMQPVRGKVTQVRPDEIVISNQGKEVVVPLAPGWIIAVIAPTTLTTIKPGSFVGTTNVDGPNGGIAREVHVFPPGSRMGEGQRIMDAGSATRMTNGTVTAPTGTAPTRMTNGGVTAVKAGGKAETVLELSFPGGTRRVVVPANAQITSFTPAEHSLLKPGIFIAAMPMPGPDGKSAARYVTTGPNGTPPVR